jgi:hypothetical protein
MHLNKVLGVVAQKGGKQVRIIILIKGYRVAYSEVLGVFEGYDTLKGISGA